MGLKFTLEYFNQYFAMKMLGKLFALTFDDLNFRI